MIINYEAKYGDTWATVSYKMYGDIDGINRLISENQSVSISDFIEPGTIIHVPIIDEVVEKTNLPFWK